MADKTIFIDQLHEGRQVDDLFLVSRKTLAETKAGKPYLALSLMDRTGEIEARLWDNAEEYDAMAEAGNFVRVRGTARSYREQLQLVVNSLAQVDEDDVRLEDFMPASPRNRDVMVAELESVIARIEDRPLHRLLRVIFAGKTLEQFSRAPAAKKMHHAYLGGLLEHTLSVTGMAARTADHYQALDRDLLLTGALVHDIAKIREFSFARLPFDYTSSGRLIGHLVLGAEMVREAASGVPDLPPDRLDQLVHLVLSHHGRHDFGAPVLPMTPEALVLHHLDDMDAKMNYIGRLREKITEPGSHWTDFQRPLERFLYLRRPEEDEDVPGAAGLLQPGGRGKASSGPTRYRGSREKNELEKRQQTLF